MEKGREMEKRGNGKRRGRANKVWKQLTPMHTYIFGFTLRSF